MTVEGANALERLKKAAVNMAQGDRAGGLIFLTLVMLVPFLSFYIGIALWVLAGTLWGLAVPLLLFGLGVLSFFVGLRYMVWSAYR